MLDVHTHLFHPKIAQKVCLALKEHYNISPQGTGLKEDLYQHLKKGKFNKAVVLCAATNPNQVIPANNWAISLKNYKTLIPFGTIHPEYKDWQKELARLAKHQIKGLKIHPDFQGFDLASKKLFPLWEEIGSKFWILIHIGDQLPPEKNFSSPQKLVQVLKNFPRLKIIVAHLGGYLHWEYALHYIIGKDIFLDTSSTLPFIPKNILKKILNKHDKEKILFGSDYPLFLPKQEKYRILNNLNDNFWAQLEENSTNFLQIL